MTVGDKEGQVTPDLNVSSVRSCHGRPQGVEPFHLCRVVAVDTRQRVCLATAAARDRSDRVGQTGPRTDRFRAHRSPHLNNEPVDGTEDDALAVAYRHYGSTHVVYPRRLFNLRQRSVCFNWRLSVYVSVCLSVCEQLHIKSTDRIFMKILPEMYVWTGKTDIEFWESSGSGSGSRNFLKGIFTIVVRDILYT